MFRTKQIFCVASKNQSGIEMPADKQRCCFLSPEGSRATPNENPQKHTHKKETSSKQSPRNASHSSKKRKRTWHEKQEQLKARQESVTLKRCKQQLNVRVTLSLIRPISERLCVCVFSCHNPRWFVIAKLCDACLCELTKFSQADTRTKALLSLILDFFGLTYRGWTETFKIMPFAIFPTNLPLCWGRAQIQVGLKSLQFPSPSRG